MDPPKQGVQGHHYLDDFLVLGAPNTMECARALETTLTTFAELGVPVAPDKVEGPSTQLVFLGIELDSQNMQASPPQEKLRHLQALLSRAQSMKCVRDYHAFDSLVGHLVHATSVMPLGRAFLSRLFPILRACHPGQIRRLNLAARKDLAWWSAVCHQWIGSSTQQFIVLNPPSHHLFTDASGSWGCGGWSLPYWFQVPWNNSLHLPSIALKELFPIVIAAAIWGHLWSGSLVQCHSDNTAAVAYVNKLHAGDVQTAHMLRGLAFFQAKYDFRMQAAHIPGSRNTAADNLSRNKAEAFKKSFTMASPSPSQVPQGVIELLIQHDHDWTSRHWNSILTDSCRRDSPPLQRKSTDQA